MFKKFFVFILLFFSSQIVFAKEIPVKIKTLEKISTSNPQLQEGDTISLTTAQNVYVNSKLYIKSGTPVVGVITNLTENGFTCKEASIYAETFKVKNIEGKKVPLKGIVFKSGRDHHLFTQFLPGFYEFIRGGEAMILPNKDTFTLYLETKDD
ncbi:MAG: hypothetical protein PHC64_05830 [Candidatus Gastranaerophilales bacterium]|nr:hypothetical protein [Candidatus Gastranaerophilales bacterium]